MNNVKLSAFMEVCPSGSGYVAWIDNSGSFNMVVRGETEKETVKELITSLNVAICYAFGAKLDSCNITYFSSEAEMLTSLKKEGKREINFQIA
jgi:hypothetical protein